MLLYSLTPFWCEASQILVNESLSWSQHFKSLLDPVLSLSSNIGLLCFYFATLFYLLLCMYRVSLLQANHFIEYLFLALISFAMFTH